VAARTHEIMLARPSLASLNLETRFEGQPLSTATGFVVEHGAGRFLITNWHVVTGRNPDTGEVLSPVGAVPSEVRVLHNRAATVGSWVDKIEPLYTARGLPKWREHPEHGRRVDAVALRLTDLEGVEVYPHDAWAAGPAPAAGVAKGLSIVGFPFGLTSGGALGVWVQGTVATEPDIDYEGLPSFLIDSRTRPGQSGSPVICDASGGGVEMDTGTTMFTGGPVEYLLGVYSGRINEQSDLGFVWKTVAIRDLVERGSKAPKPG
jgi:Trypsin-like peptidase domain